MTYTAGAAGPGSEGAFCTEGMLAKAGLLRGLGGAAPAEGGCASIPGAADRQPGHGERGACRVGVQGGCAGWEVGVHVGGGCARWEVGVHCGRWVCTLGGGRGHFWSSLGCLFPVQTSRVNSCSNGALGGCLSLCLCLGAALGTAEGSCSFSGSQGLCAFQGGIRMLRAVSGEFQEPRADGVTLLGRVQDPSASGTAQSRAEARKDQTGSVPGTTRVCQEGSARSSCFPLPLASGKELKLPGHLQGPLLCCYHLPRCSSSPMCPALGQKGLDRDWRGLNSILRIPEELEVAAPVLIPPCSLPC